MIVFGYDPPGGWAILEIGGAGPRWIESGTTGEIPEVEISDELALRRAHGVDLVCIERPTGFYPSRAMLGASGGKLAQINAGLLAAAWIGGVVAGRCRGAGLRVVEVSAPDARRHAGVKIGGRPARGVKPETVDQQIARRVPLLVAGWPPRSCAHTRDAAVAALYGYAVAKAQDARSWPLTV